jgi:hypothetical protein
MQTGVELAPRQIRALAGRWNLAEGQHPSVARTLPELTSFPLFVEPEDEVLLGIGLPVSMTTNGHHMVEDQTYLGAKGEVDAWPLAPVFVRDLCGRVIHTGLNPLAAPPAVPLFPTGCADVTATVPGADLIENSVFLSLRKLECAEPKGVLLAGQTEYQLQSTYSHPEEYPYKLRVDTFYADGWRLPQVPRVFTRNVSPIEAQEAGQTFLRVWEERPAGQGYEEFYEAQNGDAWFEELFLKGCTVIPTLEACNGRYHVGDDFRATGVDAGRAVPGLHVVAEEKDSNQPKGTILQVVEPGWAMQTMIHPAKVVISNGSGFSEPEYPQPQIPNLRWPHPKQAPHWGATWLPTHPQHFAEPALWDWGATGHFVQISGPLWDPVHYTYTSTLPILRSLRKPVEGNPYVFQLSPVLKDRFHPVTAQTWCDIFNEKTWQQRQEDTEHPLHDSALDQVVLGTPVASVGYHPLPEGLEYELDPAAFPDLNPRNSVDDCPEALANRVGGKAVLQVPVESLAKYTVVVSDGFRRTLQEAETAEILRLESGPVWLPHIPASVLLINVKRFFAQRATRQLLQTVAERYKMSTLPASIYRLKEESLAWRRLRYRMFTKYAEVWLKAWKKGLDLTTAETLVVQGEIGDSEQVRLSRAHAFAVRPVPSWQAAGLPSPRQKAKMRGKREVNNRNP